MCATCGKLAPTRREKYAGRRTYFGMHENRNTWRVHFQMTAASNSDICIAVFSQSASELRFASTCRVPYSALGKPCRMNRKFTSSHGTPRHWEKFGSGETMESTSSEEEISQASKGKASLTSAYPLKCMKVDAQHFHGSKPMWRSATDLTLLHSKRSNTPSNQTTEIPKSSWQHASKHNTSGLFTTTL